MLEKCAGVSVETSVKLDEKISSNPIKLPEALKELGIRMLSARCRELSPLALTYAVQQLALYEDSGFHH